MTTISFQLGQWKGAALTALGLLLAGCSTPIIGTIAGSGKFCVPPTDPCGDGGPVRLAKFNSPRGLTSVPDGSYLVADRFTNRIRSVAAVNPDAVINTIAGTGNPCTPKTAPCGDGGPANAAHLTIPRATSLTSAGGYLIADEGDHRIRSVASLSATAIITNVAGTGVECPHPTERCGDGGDATKAQLAWPHDVMALPGTDFIIVDTYDHRIRRVTNGTITTIVGTGVVCPAATDPCGDGGPATAAELHFPHGIVLTPDGGFLFADSDDRRIRKVSAAGIITTVAGTGDSCTDPRAACGDGGLATAAQLGVPRSLALMPDGGFLFSDVGINRIRKVSAAGIITTVAGDGLLCNPPTVTACGNGGPATSAKLDQPQDVMLTPGGFLIADADETAGPTETGDNRIRLVAPESVWRRLHVIPEP